MEKPFTISKEEVLKKISKMFPKADSVCLRYMGSGDDFEEFANLTTEIELAKPIEHKSGWIQEYETDEDISDYEKIEKFVNLEVSDGNTVENYIWEVFRKANNSPDFNDAGSYGSVKFDIKNNIVLLANTYKEYNYDDDGNIDWDDDDIENDCESEEF